MHHLLGPRNENWDDGGEGLGFENESRDAPFEIAHSHRGVLVDKPFGEDVYPAMTTGWVGGWGQEDVGTIGGVSEGARCKRVRDVGGLGA